MQKHFADQKFISQSGRDRWVARTVCLQTVRVPKAREDFKRPDDSAHRKTGQVHYSEPVYTPDGPSDYLDRPGDGVNLLSLRDPG